MTKERFSKVLSLMMIFLLLLGFIPITVQPAYGATAKSVIVGGATLNSENPYYINNEAFPTGVLGENSCAAEFNADTGTLILQDYDGSYLGRILIQSGDIEIIFKGESTINSRGFYPNNIQSENGNITIRGSEPSSKLNLEHCSIWAENGSVIIKDSNIDSSMGDQYINASQYGIFASEDVKILGSTNLDMYIYAGHDQYGIKGKNITITDRSQVKIEYKRGGAAGINYYKSFGLDAANNVVIAGNVKVELDGWSGDPVYGIKAKQVYITDHSDCKIEVDNSIWPHTYGIHSEKTIIDTSNKLDIYSCSPPYSTIEGEVEVEEGEYDIEHYYHWTEVDEIIQVIYTYKDHIAPIIITEVNDLPKGIQGEEYSFQIKGRGSYPITWTGESGLPEGLEISSDGLLSGIPTEGGDFVLEIQALNGAGSISENFNLTIVPTYIIEIEQPVNGTASASHQRALEGTEVTLEATPDDGYQFKEWEIMSGDIKIEDNKFILSDQDVVIRAIFKEDSLIKDPTGEPTIEVAYKITKGGDSSWEKGAQGDTWSKDSKEGITIVSDGPFNKFSNLYINNKLVNKKYYTVEEGSTIITLSPEYLETLEEGSYEVVFEFTDGKAETTLNILPASIEEKAKEETKKGATQTGDESKIGIIILILFLSALGLKTTIYKKDN